MVTRTAGAVDCWIGFPSDEPLRVLATLDEQIKRPSGTPATSHVDFLFGEKPGAKDADDPVDVTLAQMDEHGIDIGLVLLATDTAERAVRERPDRFRGVHHVDPNRITEAVRSIRRAHERYGLAAVYTFPAGCNPQVAVDDRRHYPVYQTCIDLDLAIIANAGIVGPRVPSWSQRVMAFDQVCYDFPELRIVMCHGAEPDEALAVKLMLKWPGLHFMTSGFAPRHYPRAIVDFANTRGADKVLYAGYYPFGLTLDRIFGELADLPLRPEIRPKFLRDNAVRVFRL